MLVVGVVRALRHGSVRAGARASASAGFCRLFCRRFLSPCFVEILSPFCHQIDMPRVGDKLQSVLVQPSDREHPQLGLGLQVACLRADTQYRFRVSTIVGMAAPGYPFWAVVY